MPVYKYLAPERFDVLLDARIRFTQPNALNDPFELKPFFKTIFNMDTFSETIRQKMDLRPALLKRYEQMPREVRRRLNPHQFVQFAMTEMDKRKEEFELSFKETIDGFIREMPSLSERFRSVLHGKLGDGIGILSLSEDPTSDLMWAHYANDHSGFVIEFNESNEFFHRQRSESDEFFRLRRVNYVDKRINFESLEQLIDEQNELFTSKMGSWAYEKEWRMLVPLFDRAPDIDKGEPIHLLPFPRSAVSAVIFGYKSSAELRNRVASILSSHADYSGVRTLLAYVDLEHGKIATKAA